MVCSEESMLHPKCYIDIHILNSYCPTVHSSLGPVMRRRFHHVSSARENPGVSIPPGVFA